MSDIPDCDLAIVGGGLAGGLIALTLAEVRPELRVTLVEAGASLGGNHVWSTFDDDLPPADRATIAPLVAHRWAGYDVRFPAFARTLSTGYAAITSERFDAVLRARIDPARLRTGRRAIALDPAGVTLSGGERIAARGVIDARGMGDTAALDLGWQKFVGHELQLAAPHGLDRPIVMDATVDQIDGYRFVYVLPFAPDRVFVEDTYYSDTPRLDVAAIATRIGGYATAQGWQVTKVLRAETGVLPVVLGGDLDRYRGGDDGVAKAGVRAGLFHPTTGYSLPDAMRLARRIAMMPDLGGAALDAMTRAYAKATWDARGFYRLLDRMLFRAAMPAHRYRVLQRFYRLDARLVGRFYAGQSTTLDKARLLAGRPPVPIGRAIRAAAGGGGR